MRPRSAIDDIIDFLGLRGGTKAPGRPSKAAMEKVTADPPFRPRGGVRRAGGPDYATFSSPGSVQVSARGEVERAIPDALPPPPPPGRGGGGDADLDDDDEELTPLERLRAMKPEEAAAQARAAAEDIALTTSGSAGAKGMEHKWAVQAVEGALKALRGNPELRDSYDVVKLQGLSPQEKAVLLTLSEEAPIPVEKLTAAMREVLEAAAEGTP